MSQHGTDSRTKASTQYRVTQPDDATWDAFVDDCRHAHLLQTSAWAVLKAQFGWTATRIALVDDGNAIVAGASILFRTVLGMKLAYVPRGPLTDWENPILTLEILDAVARVSREYGAFLLIVEPGFPDTHANQLAMQRYGFSRSPHSVQPQSTIMVNIRADEDEILKRMKSKWRYNIRLSARRDVVVREAPLQDMDAFNALMLTTGQRDGFALHEPAYYTAAHQLMTPDRAVYLIAEYEGEPLAAIVVAITGDTAVYLWGASSDRERNRMPNHALQWAGMKWAKERGAKWYDLWGIPDDLGQVAVACGGNHGGFFPAEELPINVQAMPREDLWGVFRFKQGFGGYIARDIGAWEIALRPYGRQLYAAGLKLREQRAKLRHQIANGDPRTQKDARIIVRTAEEWREVLSNLATPHVLQSWEWGDVKSQTGWVAEHVAVKEDDTTIGAYQFLWRGASDKLPFRIGYVPKGPIVDWNESDHVNIVLDSMERHARELNCIFAKIDPDVRVDKAEGVILTSKLKRRGWRFSEDQIQFKNTAYSRLSSDEELLASMKSKWRYNIRLAGRRGITIRQGDVADLPAFYAMYAETGERDGFLVRPYTYYEQAWKIFLDAQEDVANPAGGALLLATHADESAPVADLFLMKYGDCVWYFYGASTDRRRRDMPNHLLQWEAMRWARDNGCSDYDWWGAPTELADPSDSMQGVWKFKAGFGAEFRQHVGAWDYVVNPLLYSLYSEAVPRALEFLKRKRASSST